MWPSEVLFESEIKNLFGFNYDFISKLIYNYEINFNKLNDI